MEPEADLPSLGSPQDRQFGDFEWEKMEIFTNHHGDSSLLGVTKTSVDYWVIQYMGIGLGITEGELGTEQFPNCTNSCHQLKWPRRKTVFFGQTWGSSSQKRGIQGLNWKQPYFVHDPNRNTYFELLLSGPQVDDDDASFYECESLAGDQWRLFP